MGRRAGFSHYCHLSGIRLPLLFVSCFFFLVFTLKFYLLFCICLVCVYTCECLCITVVMGRLENSWDSTRMLVLKVTDKLSNLVASGLTCWAVLPSPTIYLGFEIRCRYTSQAGIELVIPPALVSQLLWLQVCTAMPSFPDYFLKPLV